MTDGHCDYCPQNNCPGYEGVVEERDELAEQCDSLVAQLFDAVPTLEKARVHAADLEAELAATQAEVARLMDSMELAWGVIANAGGGDWESAGPVWKDAAERWRDEHWHPAVARAKGAAQHG